ncbi:Uncharacterised protein [Listeria ivanovii subsp. londoniensis]|uniref:Uncharacterized protein n=1 Tax=Listeria ivanovii TaxID=1638 RepID=A0AAX2DTU5_LISIV|nr:hypothetical protein [Listeria ivanovii]SDX37138.1 hypothetical protein SAMN05421782_1194 [Listeria ivanovii]VEH45961.1 Uncharacterised protein [Listeria ivanovii subsp. londoniensis]
MQKQNVYKDDVYYKLLNKVRNHDDVTTNDLSTALWLYEKTNKELKKAKNKRRAWTDEEDEYLIYFVYSSDAELQDAADHLNRTLGSVASRLFQLRKHNKAFYIVRPWSEKEDEFIKKYYNSLTSKVITERLNRSYNAIKSRAWSLGVSKK